MTGYHVAIPSYGRPGRVEALRVFPDATLYVCEREAESYAWFYPGVALVAVPDAVEGSLARKLNWILERALSEGIRHLLRVDDDVRALGTWQLGSWRRLTVAQADAFVRDGFRMAEETRTAFWGVNVIQDKRAYSVFRPLKLLAPILGPFGGQVLDHGLRYDERMGAKEDYDFWLQMVRRYRRTLRFDGYHYAKREETVGGWYASRTMERERQWSRAIVAKWGRRVIRYDETTKNLLDGRVNIPIPGC